MTSEPKRLLVLRFSALGDVAMTVPAVYSLAELYPELHIDVVTTPFHAQLFINRPPNVHVHGLDLKGEYKGFKGFFKALKKLSDLKPDMVADLHNVLRTWLVDAFFMLKGVRVKIVDKMRNARKLVLKRKATQPNFVNRFTHVFSLLGYPLEPKFTTIFPDGVPEMPIDIKHPAVGIAPFARYYNKTYPIDRMREVVEILAESGVNVYLFGARGNEAEQLGTWTSISTRVHTLAGRFNLEQELALMARMDCIVSMDSANQHMASLTARPVVTIWGSTAPSCGFAPYGQRPKNSIIANLSCQPCSIAGKPGCPKGTLECFKALSPRMVARKIAEIIPHEAMELVN